MPPSDIAAVSDEPWDNYRRNVRVGDARWLRLDPTRNELEAALNKAAAEIIALRKRFDEAHQEDRYELADAADHAEFR